MKNKQGGQLQEKKPTANCKSCHTWQRYTFRINTNGTNGNFFYDSELFNLLLIFKKYVVIAWLTCLAVRCPKLQNNASPQVFSFIICALYSLTPVINTSGGSQVSTSRPGPNPGCLLLIYSAQCRPKSLMLHQALLLLLHTVCFSWQRILAAKTFWFYDHCARTHTHSIIWVNLPLN